MQSYIRVRALLPALCFLIAGFFCTLGSLSAQADDREAEYQRLLPLAEAGDAEAQYRLSQIMPVMFRNKSAFLARGKAKAFLEMAAKQGHVKAQRDLAIYYLSTWDPENFEKAIVWAMRAAVNGNEASAYGILADVYCAGPEYHRDSMLGHAWMTLYNPDVAYNEPPEVLDREWEEVKKQVEDMPCDKDGEVTKDYVREMHKRAQALTTAYGLQPRCFNFLKCLPIATPK